METSYVKIQTHQSELYQSTLQNINEMLNSESTIKLNHQFAISRYYDTYIHSYYTENCFKISTPNVLYKKHIVQQVSDALILAENRGRYTQTTTIFIDPQEFWVYPYLNVIVSATPVDTYQVRPHLIGSKKVLSRGSHYAIFESENFHFNLTRFLNVQNISKQ